MKTFIENEKDQISYALLVAGCLSLLCICVHLLFIALPIHKYDWSIYPRDLGQWYGIFTGQFIHASWTHLISNLPTLFVTTLILFYFYRSIGWAAFFLILSMTGLMVFLMGRNYSHIGASGLVYGLIAFIFFSGIFRRNVKSIALMGIMVIMYSGYLAGFFPSEERVSWESHLFGAISGFWTSFVFRNYREPYELQSGKNDSLESGEKEFFFQRDVFDKTRKQRQEEQEALNQNTTNWDHTGLW